MKNIIMWIMLSIIILSAIVIGIFTLVIRLKNPEMTETQLFLENWKIYLGLLVVVFVVRFITEKIK